MRFALSLPVPFLFVVALWAEPTAQEVMERLAENQDSAIEQRNQFIYTQTSRVRIMKANKKLLRDESRRYDVVPGAKGSERKLIRAWGAYLEKGRQVPFEHASRQRNDDSPEADMANDLHESRFAVSSDGRGFENELFPLTKDELPHYRFELEGEEEFRQRGVYRIRFEPVEPNLLKSERIRWHGEVLVDRQEFQPVLISTNLGKFLPFWLRTFLGVNVRQGGYSVSYRSLEPEVWFPVSYGTEFSVKALHFYKRMATVSLVSEGFRRTNVESAVSFDRVDGAP